MTRTVLHFVDTPAFGGEEQVVLTILAGLDRGQWDPILVYHPSSALGPLNDAARMLGVRVHAVPRLPTAIAAGTLLQLAWVLRVEQPAIFHAHLSSPLSCKYGLLAAGLMRVPAVVATAHLCTDLPRRPSIVMQQRFVAAQVDCYIAVSKDVARKVRETLHVPEWKLRVVLNGVLLQRPASEPCPDGLPQASWLAGRPVVFTAARLEKQKGLTYLLEAAALLPDVAFLIAGEGSERARLESQCCRLGLDDRVLFLGYRQDIWDLLAGCDLFVLPSLFEGLPVAVLEAMMAGKPVIASRVGGTNEVILHGETGLLVPPENPPALADAIRKVLSDPDLARRLATAGERRAKQAFSMERMVESVEQFYEELLHRRATRVCR